MKPTRAEIILIGNDPSLAYLIGRYAERHGWRVEMLPNLPEVKEVWERKPRLVLFASIEGLESAQALAHELVLGDTPVGVCASASDQVRAQELGADLCLLHPLTYDSFSTVLMGGEPSGA